MDTLTSGQRPAKDALFDGFAAVAAALASGRRAEIIEILAQAPRTVDELAGALDQSLANTSHHLRVLAGVGLVAATKRGRHVSYRLADDQVYGLWVTLRDVAAAHLGDLTDLARNYLGDRGEINTIAREEFEVRRSRGDISVIDVRPEPEHRAGHIPGAISVPPDHLEARLPELPIDRDIVAYCRGPYCVYADQAVRALRARGVTAYRLEDGYPEWARSTALPDTPDNEAVELLDAPDHLGLR